MMNIKNNIFHLSIIGALLSAILLTSCENDFNVNADWKDITVIYGLLDPEADTNWVRVQRAFLGDEAASLSFNNPDSIYYEDVEVILESYNRLNNNQLGSRVDSFTLGKDETSREKDPGLFATEGFKMYRTGREIDENLIYKITVRKPENNYPDASSTTDILGTSTFRFIAPNPTNPSAKIFNGRVEWYPALRSRIYEVDMVINYKELNRATNEVEQLEQKIDYEILRGSAAISGVSEKLDANKPINSFYQDIGSSFPPLKPNHLRFIKNIDIIIYAGGEDLAKYIELNEPQQGVNANKPEFPDIDNGAGLFSSRSFIELENVPLAPDIASSYYLSQRLCDLGFAYVTSGDTCICNRISGTDLERICF